MLQLWLIKKALEIEISTYGNGKPMQITSEPALSIYRRLIANVYGIPVGRGLKGRKDALAIVEGMQAGFIPCK
jgi:hypothetical protein